MVILENKCDKYDPK